MLAFLLFAAMVMTAFWPKCIGAQTPDQKTAIQWLHEGSEAVRRGDMKTGEEYFRKVIAVAPELSDGYLGLGITQLREGNADEAVLSLRRATELNSQLKGAHLFLGMSEYQAGDFAAAVASLRTELALQPNDIEALMWLGMTELERQQPDAAVVPLDRAAMLAPKNAEVLYYRARAHHVVAEESFLQMRDIDPDSVYVHRVLAETAAASKHYEQAADEYTAAIRKEPQNADLYEALGEQQERLARFDAAEQTYAAEVKLNPNSAIALYNLGKIDVEHGHAADGVPLLQRAQRLHALPAPTDFYLGLGLAETGQLDEAAHWLEQALQNNPSPFIQQSAYYQLARVYQRLNRKDDAQRALVELKRLKAESAQTVSGVQNESTPLASSSISAPANSAAHPQP